MFYRAELWGTPLFTWNLQPFVLGFPLSFGIDDAVMGFYQVLVWMLRTGFAVFFSSTITCGSQLSRRQQKFRFKFSSNPPW